jgi:hypothetical protein
LEPVNRVNLLLQLLVERDNMGRPAKPPRVTFASDLPPEILEALRAHSAETGTPLNRLFERAVKLLLPLLEREKENIRREAEEHEYLERYFRGRPGEFTDEKEGQLEEGES